MRLIRLSVQTEQGKPEGNIWVHPNTLETIQDMGDGQCILELGRGSWRIAGSAHRVAQMFEQAMKDA